MAPKDKDPRIQKKSGVIYRYQCDMVECDEEYIAESLRNFGERFREHLKAPSPIFDHFNITGHNVTINNFNIVEREAQSLMRTIKEAVYIRVNDPCLNRNIGKYHLPHVWDEVLFNTPELKLKQLTLAVFPSITGINICHKHIYPTVAIPSATVTITSGLTICCISEWF